MARPATHAVSFDALPGWRDDPLDGAISALARSLPALQDYGSDWPGAADLRAHCAAAAELVAAGEVPEAAARAFFEERFVPHAVDHDAPDGLLTGYYEPILSGSRRRSSKFDVPILQRPTDLVTLVDDALRASAGLSLTHARQGPSGIEPYPTRQQIEEGALDGIASPLLYLADPVDAFFLHVQGSGLIELDDGDRVRIGYDGKNGHPYSSVGRYIISLGAMTADDATLESIKDWLKADAQRGRTP